MDRGNFTLDRTSIISYELGCGAEGAHAHSPEVFLSRSCMCLEMVWAHEGGKVGRVASRAGVSEAGHVRKNSRRGIMQV